jgi:hypothetical protein
MLNFVIALMITWLAASFSWWGYEVGNLFIMLISGLVACAPLAAIWLSRAVDKETTNIQGASE